MQQIFLFFLIVWCTFTFFDQSHKNANGVLANVRLTPDIKTTFGNKRADLKPFIYKKVTSACLVTLAWIL